MEKIIRNFVQEVEGKSLKIEGIAVADEKELIIEHRFRADAVRNIYSHTKSYMSTAVGIAVSQGLLQLSDRLAEAVCS